MTSCEARLRERKTPYTKKHGSFSPRGLPARIACSLALRRPAIDSLSPPSEAPYLPPPLIYREQIALRVRELGARITADYAGQSLTLIGALKGCYMFMADL